MFAQPKPVAEHNYCWKSKETKNSEESCKKDRKQEKWWESRENEEHQGEHGEG